MVKPAEIPPTQPRTQRPRIHKVVAGASSVDRGYQVRSCGAGEHLARVGVWPASGELDSEQIHRRLAMSDGWRPLSVREGLTSAAEYDGPHDGVPDWMLGPLWGWVVGRYPTLRRAGTFFPASVAVEGSVENYRRLASALRVSIEDGTEPHPNDARGLQARLFERVRTEPYRLLDVADYWLGTVDFKEPLRGHDDARNALQGILAAAGSVYHVQEGSPPYLARVIGPETQAAADALMTAPGRSGQHLALAWRAIYGRPARAGEGYRECIRAVEAAVIPVVSPNNAKATLGTVIGELRSAPDKWTVALHSPSPDHQVPAVTGMLELLWRGQGDRHGTPDLAVPLSVTQEQAETAVHLALPLVQFFTAGVVKTR
jgi:hypothetical protein